MRGRHRLVGPLVACAIAIGLAACGSGDDAGTSGKETGVKPLEGGPPIGESVADAQRRIAGALATGDCARINELAPLQEGDGAGDPERCAQLRNLTNLELAGKASYSALGGVIDYRTTDGVVSAVLVRDRDGLLHVAFVNPFNRRPTVGTPLARAFDRVATDAVDALRDKDCAAFLRVAFRRFGEGGLPDPAVCRLVRAGGLNSALSGGRKARPVRSGGNGYYAFYGLNTPDGFFTLVLAEESSSVPPSVEQVAPPLPAGAPRFGFVQAYLTNAPAAD